MKMNKSHNIPLSFEYLGLWYDFFAITLTSMVWITIMYFFVQFNHYLTQLNASITFFNGLTKQFILFLARVVFTHQSWSFVRFQNLTLYCIRGWESPIPWLYVMNMIFFSFQVFTICSEWPLVLQKVIFFKFSITILL